VLRAVLAELEPVSPGGPAAELEPVSPGGPAAELEPVSPGGLAAELEPVSPGGLAAEVKRLWDTLLEPAAIADGIPADVIDFLRTRMLRSCPTGLWSMGHGLLGCPDRTPALATLGAPLLVVYGENDDAWAPSIQDEMAQRLSAQRVCIPGAGHSPAVEAPETLASTLTTFWNSVENNRGRR
jgi:pimeloyl-ACP methyl ester carboxylesterase